MLDAIKSLHGKETIGDASGRHFSWVNHNFYESNDLEEIMADWRWEVFFNGNGDINEIEFVGQKIGDDEILFKAIAPFVEDGSYIEMCGEDGLMWRWEFKDGRLIEKTAHITWVAE